MQEGKRHIKPGRYIVLAVLIAYAMYVGVKKYRAHRALLATQAAAETAHPKIDSTKPASQAPVMTAADSAAIDSAARVHAPPNSHIVVEVYNATGKPGLAKKATTYLRDRGFDVVFTSSLRNPKQWIAHSVAIDRSGHPAWATIVGQAMRAHVESHADTTRYVDVTVLIGSDWAPPPLPFYP